MPLSTYLIKYLCVQDGPLFSSHFYIKSRMIQCIDRGKSLNFARDVQLDRSVRVLEKLTHISQTLLLEKDSESRTFTGFGQTSQLAQRVREPSGTKANVSPQGGNNETHSKASWISCAAKCKIIKSTSFYIVCAKWICPHSEPWWEIVEKQCFSTQTGQVKYLVK